MSEPTVSVIVPTYNRQPLLPRAIDSVVAQTFGDWEIVLVDDGSTDSTREMADRYSHQLGDRFVYIPQPNRGASAARNRGIDVCRGRFVAFLDSDDEFLPTKLGQLELPVFVNAEHGRHLIGVRCAVPGVSIEVQTGALAAKRPVQVIPAYAMPRCSPTCSDMLTMYGPSKEAPTLLIALPGYRLMDEGPYDTGW